MSSLLTTEQRQKARGRLRIIKWVGLFDAVLLIALIASSLIGNRDLVRVLGPLHGGNFLLLLTLVGVGASDGLWSWWFPAGVLFTGGPLGALVGEYLVGRKLDRQAQVHVQAQEGGAA
jgi:hypothetical protein